MKNFKQIIIVGTVIILVVLVVLFIYLSQKKNKPTVPLSIINSIPTEGAAAVSVFDSIKITFNQNVDFKTISIASEPSENWTITQDAPDSIIAKHDLYLKVATTYKLILLQNNKTIGKLTFETARDQNDPRLLQNLKTQLDKNYPLAAYTPYETASYRVVYSAPLTLEIDLKKPINTQDAISQVESWVRSYGIDPTTHKYNVAAPSSTPQP